MAKFISKQIWRKNADSILKNNPNRKIINDTLFAVLKQIENNDWKGACHATCGVVHVLLNEQGIKNKLVLGEAQKGQAFFNHSWIEIDKEIYDLAIGHPLVPEYSNPPTIKGYNIETTKLTEIKYGVNSGLEDDMPTTFVKSVPLSTYFDNFPGHPTLGLWVVVLDASHQIGLSINIDNVMGKYVNTNWDVK